tara:strand:- start:63 stop:548 length:486 start_codon:yes stop_codon:yes gene_type:complete
MRKEEAYQRGVESANSGETECPYEDNEMAKEWNRGYFIQTTLLEEQRLPTVKAVGIKGFLCKGIDGKFFFRVYSEKKDENGDKRFVDYHIAHHDLQIVLDDEDAVLNQCSEEEGVIEYDFQDDEGKQILRKSRIASLNAEFSCEVASGDRNRRGVLEETDE